MPQSTKDYYEILQVDRTATEEEIKKAFRRRARDLHPDVNSSPNADEEFKDLNEAYDVLSDVNKRAHYDRFGTAPSGSAGAGGYVDFEDIFGGFGGMGDIFSTFFGGAGRSSKPQSRNGRDMGVGIDITLEEAASGVKKEIIYDRLAPCDECDGSGLGPDGKIVSCTRCNGSGNVVTVQRTILGEMQARTVCDVCSGTGQAVEGACDECSGQGRVPDRQRISIEVPKGVHDGQQLKISDMGEAGIQGAPSGNLIATVRIKDHECFKRDRADLHAALTVQMLQAALGSQIQIDGILPDEKIEVNVPAGTQPGDSISIKGKGMPKVGGNSRGNLILHINIEIPKKIKSKHKKLLEDMASDTHVDLKFASAKLDKLEDLY